MRHFLKLIAHILILCIVHFASAQTRKEIKLHKKASKRLAKWSHPFNNWQHIGIIEIDSFSVDAVEKIVTLQFSKTLSYFPIREENCDLLIGSIESVLGKKFRDYQMQVKTNGQDLHELIPNLYRNRYAVDTARIRPVTEGRIPLVQQIGRPVPEYGLFNRNIALWHSHGWYFEQSLNRWEWQRARIYQTVEDLFPMTFVLPYLVPMLENAGANIFLPRERDTQIHEVIVDNDVSSDSCEFKIVGVTPVRLDGGFLKKDTLYPGEIPFLLGSALNFEATDSENNYVEYVPYFTEDGNYAVYVSFRQDISNSNEAIYSVFHTGGKTDFRVNQQFGGSTWVYLGTFNFRKGKDAAFGSVRLSGKTGIISTDAIRFGGGSGNVARKPMHDSSGDFSWKTSMRPRFMEAARYYLQYAGVPDTLVFSLNEEKNDYNDDYKSRGEWVNYLMGKPSGPTRNRQAEGLNIPIDLSLAFHTDAGITPNDSTIGTLAIYSANRDHGQFPSSQSKLASRDLVDIVQSQIVQDIRQQFDADWTRRAMWDKEYSEAWRPNVPAMLLELLSHQNIADMKLGHDPRFKFAVSRAIYKGIVKFLAFQNNNEYVIQPLPVNHFAIEHLGGKRIKLSWKPVQDSLEKSAVPTAFILHTRTGAGGFDNGKMVIEPEIEIDLPERNTIYGFKIVAINSGGESLGSEILSVGLADPDIKPVLVVNGFDRISAPATVEKGGFAGFAHWEDEGVAHKFNYGYTGAQYDFDRESPWLDDDSPGWGASYADMEGKPVPGNSFDNPYIHGRAIMNAGYSFVSTSDEAFSKNNFNADWYFAIDLIFGEEKTSGNGKLFKAFDAPMMAKLKSISEQGGNIFISGAYIGTDHILNEDTVARDFAAEVLHYKWRTNHAARTGQYYAEDGRNKHFSGNGSFNTIYHPTIYKVEAPDAIEPVGNAACAFRYSENNVSAGVVYEGKHKVVALGFPFETVIDENNRTKLMREILGFFEDDR